MTETTAAQAKKAADAAGGVRSADPGQDGAASSAPAPTQSLNTPDPGATDGAARRSSHLVGERQAAENRKREPGS